VLPQCIILVMVNYLAHSIHLTNGTKMREFKKSKPNELDIPMSNTNGRIANRPEMIERNTNEICIPRLHNEVHINQYFEQNNDRIENSGVISESKLVENIRVLSINPHGCIPNNQSKMTMMKEAIRKYQIDILLMNETNTK